MVEQLRREVERLGYRMVPPTFLVRQVVAYIRETGEATASSLADIFEIKPTAASNRLRAAARAGFLVEWRRGRELVFELVEGVADFPWVDEGGTASCPLCDRRTNHIRDLD